MSTTTQRHAFTNAHAPQAAGSRAALWTGRTLSGLAVLFLAVDSLGKLLELDPVVAGTTELGYPATLVSTLGVTLLACVLAYANPRTAVLGAVLLTGYLGGAVATHLRLGAALVSHVLSPVYVAFFVWGGLYLRDARLRALLPWRRRA